jgi:3-methyladenine DNA glycosylase AlkD
MKEMAILSVSRLRQDLRKLADPEKAKVYQSFFKTDPGQYGEGDRFIGVVVPVVRRFVREYRELALKDVKLLLRSPIHEERLLALLILVQQYRRGDEKRRQTIFELYLKSRKWINNWDLIDVTAEHIVGAHLSGGDHSLLIQLVSSERLWDRRIGIIATFHEIRRGRFKTTLLLAKRLLDDKEDLIHKATGWMLREIGKRDLLVLDVFLTKHHRRMPRTMLRYAIERFPEKKRQAYLRPKTKNLAVRR